MNRDYRIRDIMIQYQKEICYYSQMQSYAKSTYEKNYYQNLIYERTEEMIKVLETFMIHSNEINSDSLPNNQQETEINNQDGNQMPSENLGEIPEDSDNNQNQDDNETRVFTADELNNYNGANGNPTYVAVNGVVYDISGAKPWINGKHNGLTAGMDLTNQFTRCHRGMIQTLEKYPIVGLLKSEIEENE